MVVWYWLIVVGLSSFSLGVIMALLFFINKIREDLDKLI